MDSSLSNDPLIFVGSNENQKFGEIYCNFEGKLTFQCVFCPSQMKDVTEFNIHYIIHFREVFVVKKEDEACVFEPEIGIDVTEAFEINHELINGSGESYDDSVYDRNDIQSDQVNQLDCTMCNKTFESQYGFVRHIQNHALFPESFNCDICGSNIKKKKDLLGHMKDKHSGIKHPCSICGKEFNRSSYLSVHKRIHEDVRPFKCTTCGHAFITAGALSFHMKKHNNTMPQCPCQYCGKVFDRSGALVEHVRLHTGEKPFDCDICSQNFRTKRHLRQHKASHLTLKEYPCDTCGMNFERSSEVISHKRKVHSDIGDEIFAFGNTKSLKTSDVAQKATINCYLCDKAFVSQANLNQHIQNHSLYPDSFECDICGSKIKKKKDLLDHMKHTHSGIKYPCNICAKQFSRSSYLIVHMRMHNEDRPHQCAVCGKTFIMAGALTFHMRKHNNTLTQLPCSTCGKVFNRPGALADHIRVHTGEKPFKCEICQSSFRTRKYFNEHKQIHLDVKNHACDLCGMKFKQAAGVRNHKRKVHGKRVTSKRLKVEEVNP